MSKKTKKPLMKCTCKMKPTTPKLKTSIPRPKTHMSSNKIPDLTPNMKGVNRWRISKWWSISSNNKEIVKKTSSSIKTTNIIIKINILCNSLKPKKMSIWMKISNMNKVNCIYSNRIFRRLPKWRPKPRSKRLSMKTINSNNMNRVQFKEKPNLTTIASYSLTANFIQKCLQICLKLPKPPKKNFISFNWTKWPSQDLKPATILCTHLKSQEPPNKINITLFKSKHLPTIIPPTTTKLLISTNHLSISKLHHSTTSLP